MLKINNVSMPTPTDFTPGIMDISKAERNAFGTMIIERIATKRKLELKYTYLTQTELASLLTAVSGVSFTVEYPDPQTNGMRVGNFYCGDRRCAAIDYGPSGMRWKDISFSLVEL